MFIWYDIIRNLLKAPDGFCWWHFDVHEVVISLKVDLLVVSFSRSLLNSSVDIGHKYVVNIKFCICFKANMLISSVPARKWLQLIIKKNVAFITLSCTKQLYEIVCHFHFISRYIFEKTRQLKRNL